EQAFRDGFELALTYAQALGAGAIHVMSGSPGVCREAQARATFFDNLRWAADRAGSQGPILLIEPLNTRDRPGYFVSRSDDVVALLEELDLDRVKLMFDAYHIQIMEGDLLRRLERHWPRIGHVQ